MRRVEAADVEGRIGLRIAEPLRLLETGLEREALGLHARKNVVAGAVEDAGDTLDRVAGEALAQRLDHRNAAADGGLVIERRLTGLGERRELEPVLGEHRLVGGDDRQTAIERRLDRVEGRSPRAANQLDEDVDLARSGHLGRIDEEDRAAEVDGPVFAARAIGRNDASTPCPCDEVVMLPAQELNEARAHHANAGDAQAQRLFHHDLAWSPDFQPKPAPQAAAQIDEKRENVQPYRS